MDNKSIEISTNLTTEDLKRIGFMQVRIKLIILGVTLIVFVIMATIGIIAAVLSKNSNVHLATFLPVLLPLGIFSFALFSIVRAVNSQAKQVGDRVEPTDYIFDEQGMKAENASTSVKTLWLNFLKAEETKTDFLLFTHKNVAVPIPKRFFTTDKVTEFRNLLAEKLGKQAKLKN